VLLINLAFRYDAAGVVVAGLPVLDWPHLAVTVCCRFACITRNSRNRPKGLVRVSRQSFGNPAVRFARYWITPRLGLAGMKNGRRRVAACRAFPYIGAMLIKPAGER
jgi:hypothetical protein